MILTDAELAAVAPRKTRTIDIEAFVDVADVDPIYFDHPFVLVPSGVEHGFRNNTTEPVRILNIHAPAGIDRRIGLQD